MTVTFIGLIMAAIGLLLLIRGSLAGMLAFLMLSGMMGGSAAIILTAVGGSSIPPAQFALAFIWLRMVIPGSRFLDSLGPAFKENLWLIVFVVYGLVIAYVGPRLFAGQINVTPLRFEGGDGGLFDTSPLMPTSQNMTASVYLIGALLTAVATYVACIYRGGANALVKTAVVIAWFHSITGIMGAVGRGTPIETFFTLLRNANYTQHNQAYEGFIRINGIFPEPSSWAAFAFSWFVFLAECWYRSIEPKATGRAALLLGLVMFFSTSSSAYVGLGGYALFFAARIALFPTLASHSRIKEAAIIGLAGAVLTAILLAALPAFTEAIGEMIDDMLFAKADSESGRQRLFWALQGLDSFVVSWGLGIGPGSFRSSSLATAIIGSCGVIGVVSFVAYLLAVFEPRRGSSWGASGSLAARLGGAAATAAVVSQIPSLVAAPSPVPTGEFAILAGAALALRRVKPRNMQQGGDGEADAGIEVEELPPLRRGWRISE
ncbi:glycoside hydrolase [Croceicoccus sp. Ery15]|uniref:glycoside hydrolase n=1 Tax=Croceicoccus sp. Ery15 TaxID=1703338 RepID=UPI001E2F2540|nr:glycoside hydrolase [Croceicoccus sp. Ery15]